ncbi:diacylglycerol glucosyltransferase [Paenibacillus sp. J5C_2022]|uniref:MGDG synthase family glycosyltransferase n=1 Tax=Paenibacillus sp. J5C2022 TaxID=2977129 RepID=UPI0021D3D704|nr:glycosyltransferase [Paenibacillus sp. J5C2022]MCU6713169.1 diacylglycerol glucosyltransferase [Paenibacillus sp. J5C2022]
MPYFINQTRQSKLLIVYASYGQGHYQAACALRDALKERGNANTVMVDLMAESHPLLNEVTRQFYLKSYTHMPQVYGWVYDWTKPMKHDSLFGQWLHSFGRQKLQKLIRQEQPDAVIHTFPLFTLPSMRGKQRVQPIPSFAVLTDFDLHRRWVHPSVDRYYVPTPDMRLELQQLGMAPSRIKVSGIPLKPQFHLSSSVKTCPSRYGMHPGKLVALVMAGAQGVMPNVQDICAGLLRHESLQVVLVCGRNDALRSAMKQKFGDHPASHRLHLFGFVEQIHELMSIADCLITKPGGLTLAEGIAAGLPLFLYRPVPGQEKQNALYLESKGAAFIYRDTASLTAGVLSMLGNPLRLEAARSSIRALQANTQSAAAAKYIVDDVLFSLRLGNKASMYVHL